MTTSPGPDEEPVRALQQEVLTAEEAAAFLRITPHTLRLLVKDGRIRGRKVGREWRFWRPALIAWLVDEGDEDDGNDNLGGAAGG